MRLVLSIGYINVLLPKHTDATLILNSFEEFKSGSFIRYGKSRKFIIDSEDDVNLHVVKDENIEIKEEPKDDK